MVPCTGALIVMLFGLANDLVIPAVMMVIAISAGMALAMSAIGVAAILGRNWTEARVAVTPNGGCASRRARASPGGLRACHRGDALWCHLCDAGDRRGHDDNREVDR
ncbi:MAG: hypothetical protein JKP98_23550 [Rhodobacteraceae bacterium]|nr:hypothetical protein [Paracoccaceae bacterium]